MQFPCCSFSMTKRNEEKSNEREREREGKKTEKLKTFPGCNTIF